MIYETIIIGGGPAGMAAAIYAARSGLNAVLLERSSSLGGQLIVADWIDNYPGFPEGINGADLMNNFALQVERFQVPVHYEGVEKLELNGLIKKVQTSQGTYESRTVVLATGAEHRTLNIPGEARLTGAGVSYCAVCDGMFFRKKKVVVIGGGDTALKGAEYLTRFAREVVLVHRRDLFRGAKVLDDKVRKNERVRLLLNTIPLAIEGEQTVTGILLRNKISGEEHREPCDGVFLFVGTAPNSELITQEILDENGYVVTDENMATVIPGVFACGDLRRKALRQVSTAAGEGAAAADSAFSYLASLSQ